MAHRDLLRLGRGMRTEFDWISPLCWTKSLTTSTDLCLDDGDTCVLRSQYQRPGYEADTEPPFSGRLPRTPHDPIPSLGIGSRA